MEHGCRRNCYVNYGTKKIIFYYQCFGRVRDLVLRLRGEHAARNMREFKGVCLWQPNNHYANGIGRPCVRFWSTVTFDNGVNQYFKHVCIWHRPKLLG